MLITSSVGPVPVGLLVGGWAGFLDGAGVKDPFVGFKVGRFFGERVGLRVVGATVEMGCCRCGFRACRHCGGRRCGSTSKDVGAGAIDVGETLTWEVLERLEQPEDPNTVSDHPPPIYIIFSHPEKGSTIAREFTSILSILAA